VNVRWYVAILENSQNVIYKDIKKQVHHIQILLADKIYQYKKKSIEMVDENIKILQEIYQEIY